ncbi:transcription antitermination factor NusB [bacterium]|nr:transcription antitermination factor NusB [bacterium]
MALYAWQIGKTQDLSKIEAYCLNYMHSQGAETFFHDLLNNVVSNIKEIDSIIMEKSRNWDFDRISVIDKNILRIGIAELLYFNEIPPKSTIDEAIELAKTFGSVDSSKFVNGILDAVFHEILNPEESV